MAEFGVDNGASDAAIQARSGRILLLFGISLIGVSGVLHVERALFATGDAGSALAAVEVEDAVFAPPAPAGGNPIAFGGGTFTPTGFRAPVLTPARSAAATPALRGIVPAPLQSAPPVGGVTAPPTGSGIVGLASAPSLIAPTGGGGGGTQLASLQPSGFPSPSGGGSIGGLPGTSSTGGASTGGTSTGGDTGSTGGTTTSTGGTTTSTGGDTTTTSGGTTTSTGGTTTTSTGGTTTSGGGDQSTSSGGTTSTGGIGSSGSIVPPPVPEPGVWMLMILGFGMVGHALRRIRASARSVDGQPVAVEGQAA